MNKVYRKLAFTNIKNNGSLYLPYIISGIVTVAMFYIMMFLNNSKGLEKIYGSSYLTSIMALGVRTIAVFSYIFIFYTNSFIIKRRKKEIGVYNILGMEKRHIAKLMGIETVTVALIAIIGGIVTGILFSKLSILLLYKILAVKETVKFPLRYHKIEKPKTFNMIPSVYKKFRTNVRNFLYVLIYSIIYTTSLRLSQSISLSAIKPLSSAAWILCASSGVTFVKSGSHAFTSFLINS